MRLAMGQTSAISSAQVLDVSQLNQLHGRYVSRGSPSVTPAVRTHVNLLMREFDKKPATLATSVRKQLVQPVQPATLAKLAAKAPAAAKDSSKHQ